MNNRNLDVLLCEQPEPTYTWLTYCGAAGKPSDQRRKQTQPAVSGETCLLDSKKCFSGVGKPTLAAEGQAGRKLLAINQTHR